MERDAAITQFAQYLQRRFPDRRTMVDYCSDVRQFAATCVKPWRDVTMHDIDDFVDRQRQSGLKPDDDQPAGGGAQDVLRLSGRRQR